MGHPVQTWAEGISVRHETRVELLGPRYSRWLDKASKPWSVREDGVALEGSQRGRGRKHCLLHVQAKLSTKHPKISKKTKKVVKETSKRFQKVDKTIKKDYRCLEKIWGK